MLCRYCGRQTDEQPDSTGVPEYPEQDYEPVVYSDYEQWLMGRRDARARDWQFFRDKATAVNLIPNLDDDERREVKRSILLLWDKFSVLKYGPDYGLNCSVKREIRWEQDMDVSVWYEEQVAALG